MSIYVYMNRHVLLKIDTRAHAHTHTHTCTHTYIRTYKHTHIHTYIHPCMHACIHTYIHPSMHACMHTYIHVDVCIYLYMQCISNDNVYMQCNIMCVYIYIYVFANVNNINVHLYIWLIYTSLCTKTSLFITEALTEIASSVATSMVRYIASTSRPRRWGVTAMAPAVVAKTESAVGNGTPKHPKSWDCKGINHLSPCIVLETFSCIRAFIPEIR